MAPASAPARRVRAPHVNCHDIPELLPGAQPSATPAQRYAFEERCRELHRREEEDERERQEARRREQPVRLEELHAADLQAMFPAFDPELILTLAEELPTVQHALDTLLALSAAAGEAAAEPPAAPRAVGVEDHDTFPTLTDADGWQVASQRHIEALDEDLGSVWCERARAAVAVPAPKAARPVAASAGARRRASAKPPQEEDAADPLQPLTDYEFRHGEGQRRERRRARYGRGRGAGAGLGVALRCGAALAGAGPRGDLHELESVSSEATEASVAMC